MTRYAIQTILRGLQYSDNLSQDGQFKASLSIDPLMPATDASGDRRPSGQIRPVQLAKFSATAIDDAPKWMISNPKDTNMYVYCNDGKVQVVNSSLAMGTALNSDAQIGDGTGNGMEYYQNSLWIATGTDIARYHRMDSSPTLDDDYWTAVLSHTALVDTTYPSINSIEMPNHVMHRHINGDRMYICDVVDNVGVLHFIEMKKTTNEGDTDDGSTDYSDTTNTGTLDINYGIYPTTITSFGQYLLIGAIEGVSTDVHQRAAKLLLWDTVSNTFEDITIDNNFSEPLITALLPLRDGSVMIFSGKAGGGCRIDRLYGINAVEPVAYLPDAFPPFQGAVDSMGERVVFGSRERETTSAGNACVYAFGSHDSSIPLGMHNIMKATAVGVSPQVTALKYFNQSGFKQLPIVGWKDDTTQGLDKVDTTANTSIVVKAFFDNGSSNVTIATIQSSDTRFTSRRKIELRPSTCVGKNDFYLQFTFSNGAVFQTDKQSVFGEQFSIDYITFNLADVIDASFVGTIELPIIIDIDDEI